MIEQRFGEGRRHPRANHGGQRWDIKVGKTMHDVVELVSGGYRPIDERAGSLGLAPLLKFLRIRRINV